MTVTDSPQTVADSLRRTAGRGLPAKAHSRVLIDNLLAIPPEARIQEIRTLDDDDADELFATVEKELGTPYGLWVDDPVGFVTSVLGESTWSKQRAVLQAVARTKRVAVPSAFGTGKTHIAARIALWRSLVYPVGTSLTVTTATRFRQVQRQLWPHIRSCVANARLPLVADQTQLKATTPEGTEVVVAYGFSAPPGDEAAVQGIHAPRLTIIIDEAGGIGRVIGQAMRGLLTGDDTRMLAIGNPPTDDESSWFETLTLQPDVETVRISAYDAPLQTGEFILCEACPPSVGPHNMGVHLVDGGWISDAVRDHGEDSPFVQAKVYARFPHGGPSRAIPAQWLDDAWEAPEPADQPGYVALNALGLEGEHEPYRVAEGAWIRLGVDVAAEGGDEFAIARMVGDLITLRHTSSGADNANPVAVAGVVLTEIKRAEALRHRLGTVAKVRVKIDAIGVGWGVTGLLREWGMEGLHSAEIVPVIVSEATGREDPHATMLPYRKRDEMWLAARSLLTPDHQGLPAVRLRVDDRTRAQLAAPTYSTSSTGKTVIESKKSMKARGLNSPDRGEAVLMCPYEPLVAPVRRARVIV